MESSPLDEVDVGLRASTFRFRTSDERYAWLNTTFGVLESVLDTVGVGGRAHGRLYGCRATLT